MKKVTRKIGALFMAFVVCLTLLLCVTDDVKAEVINISMDGFEITFYDDGNGYGSLWVTGYTGTDPEITLPTEIHYNGKTYKGSGCVGSFAFEGNTTIKKVIIPKGYESITDGAFSGCTNLEEVIIGDTGESYGSYFAKDIFVNCPNLKTLRLGMTRLEGGQGINYGFGTNASGVVYPGVTAYVIQGSDIDTYLKNVNDNSTGNKINIVYQDNPAKDAAVQSILPRGEAPETTTGSASEVTSGKQMEPTTGGTTGKKQPVEKTVEQGKSLAATEKLVTAMSSEADMAGSLYSGLQLKSSKVANTSVRLSWKKVNGAKNYVVFGNACGKKNKYVKLLTVSGTSANFKTIGSTKIKKGTYYKFIVIAVNSNGNVISTSKTVHAATKGGKVGNAKKVSVNKKKVSVAVKKTFKIKAKEVATSKKLKVKKHRKTAFESTNPKVALVNVKGVITGKSKGSCEIYVYAQNGVCEKIKVTVK